MTRPSLRNLSTAGFWPLEGEAFSLLFDRYVPFAVPEEADIAQVEACVAAFNAFDAALVDALCLASLRYRDDTLRMTGRTPAPYRSPREVLQAVSPVTLIIPEQRQPGVPVVHLELACDWDIDHGMEWVVRESRVRYVGAFNDCDPWSDFEPKDPWNHA